MINKLFFTILLLLIASKGFCDDYCIEDLFSSSPEEIVTLTESQDFLIGGIVHPLSGQPCLHQTDMVAVGAQSIAFKRTFIPFYTPLNEHNGRIHSSDNSYGGWVHFPHSHLNVFKAKEKHFDTFFDRETIVSVADPLGTVLAYTLDKNGNTRLKSKQWGICNGVHDHPSGSYDPRNTSISIGERGVNVQAPDGTKRYYVCTNQFKLDCGKKNYDCFYCLLMKEILPNGKVLYYHHNNERQLIKVQSLDPQEKYVYATLNIDAPLKETLATCSTNTGLEATYIHDSSRFFEKNKHECYVDLLYPLHFTNANTPSFENEVIKNFKSKKGNFHLTEYFGKHLIFKCKCQQILGKKKKEKKQPWLVHELSMPKETEGFAPIYSMQYAQGVPGEEPSTTTVTHCDGIKTVYTFTPQMLPEKISEFDQQGSVVKEKTFTWTANQWLKSIKITDGRQLLSEKKFDYDNFGNPISEILTGDLTGSGQIENNEIKRFYSTDRRNLLLREEHSNGKVVCYTYLPETNLLTSCLIKENGKHSLSREFRRYDNCNNLIQVIYDDGSGDTADDLTDVSERKITNYHLRQQQPFLHMPEFIEFKYLEDGTEKLLKKTHLLYDAWGNVSQETVFDSEGKLAYTIYKEYDKQGNLRSERNSLGQKASYTYDAHGREKTSWDFANTLFTSYDYDPRGRLQKTRETAKDGLVRDYLYSHDNKNRLVKRTDSYNHSTTYTYDLIANKAIQIDQPDLYHADGTVIAVTEKSRYDALGRKILSIDANGNAIRYTYNIYDSPTSIVYPDNSQEIFRYGTNGLLASHKSQNGLTIDYEYDVLGNVICKSFSFAGEVLGNETFEYKGEKLLKSYDLEGDLTQYTYDGAGRKIAEEKCGCLTTYQYDPLGEIGMVCEENGENSLQIHFKRDLLGRVLEKKRTDVNGALLRKIAYTYDDNGNVKTIERKINGQDAVETFAYDAYNRKISHQDAQGNLTTIHYDEKAFNAFGQQVLKRKIKDPQQISTVETYDPYGRLVKQEKLNEALQTISAKGIDYDACGNSLFNHEHVYERTDYLTTKTVKWSYDRCHRVKEMTRAFNTPEARTTKWSYHPGGKVASKTQPDGMVLSYTYDPFNQLKLVKSSEKTLSHSFTYNRLGHLLSAVDDVNHLEIKREVDPHGNVLMEEFPEKISVEKAYDHFHRPISMSLPDGGSVVYQYDPLFLKKVERISSSGKTVYEHAYESYDESGYLLAERLLADLGCVKHVRDTKGQPVSISSDYFKQECCYDEVGNMTSQVVNGADLIFDYDDLSQLISEPVCSYGYDSLYNRTQENGNKIEYNGLDEPQTNRDIAFTYDLRGNLTGKSDASQTQKFRYDPLDRLIEAEVEGKTINYAYDPLGRKLSKTVECAANLEEEYFFYDGRNEIGVASDRGEISQLRVLGLGSHPEQRNIVAIELEKKAYAPLLDIQGNIRSLVDVNAKSVAATYDYTAFGKLLPLPNRVFNPWQYASKRFDPDLGLIDFGKRHYDPQLGRWLSTDPAGFFDSHNLYQFNLNNPFRYFDPNGEAVMFFPLLWAAFGVTATSTAVVTFELVTAEIILEAALVGLFYESMRLAQEAINDSQPIPNQSETVETEAKEEKKKKNNSKGGPPRDGSTSDYLPDPAAEGSLGHTRFGTRSGSSGKYTQGSTFNEKGEFIRRTDVTSHGRADHENPHFHDATSPNGANGPARPMSDLDSLLRY